MVKGIPGPGKGPEPVQPEPPKLKEVKTGFEKTYTAAKAPGFKAMLEYWFPGEVTPKMVSSFEQGVMQMIQSSIKEAKQQHEKIQEKIKRRIQEQ